MVGRAMKSNAVAAPEKTDRKIGKRDSENKVGKSSKKQKLATAKDSVLEKKISEATTSEENPASKSEQDFKGKKHAEKSEEKEVKTSDGQKFCPKTLFIGNLSYDVSEDNIKEFFKHVGEIVDVRLAKDRRGRSKGLGHVEFADEEAAQKAMEKNKKELLGREINLEFARQKGAYTPNRSKGTSWTVFVTGFDKLQDLHKIEKSLREYFGSCGAITRVSTPTDRESGGSKGIAYLDFKDQAAFLKALKLNKTNMGDCTLAVVKAKPKPKSDSQGDSFDGRGGRGSGSHGGGGEGGANWFDRPTKSHGKHIKFD